MSMHEIEAFIEIAIWAVESSGLPIGEKRNLIYTLLELESYGDCGFTNCRTMREMVCSSYTFLFDKEEMWDYAQNQNFYDKKQYIKAGYNNGDLYVYHDYDDRFPEGDGKICVDSGSDAWKEMVRCGKITGAGSAPVELLDFAFTMLTADYIIYNQSGGMDEYTKSGYHNLVFMSGIPENLPADTSEETFYGLTGMSKQEYENGSFEGFYEVDDDIGDERPDDMPLGRVYRFCGDLVTIVPMLDYTDGLFTLHGYRSLKPVKTKHGVLSLHFLYRGGPSQHHVFGAENNPDSYAWYSNRGRIMPELEMFKEECDSIYGSLQSCYPELENLLSESYLLSQSGEIMKNPKELTDILTKIIGIYENTEVPEEVKSQDSFALIALSILNFSSYVSEVSRIKKIQLATPEFIGRAECFAEYAKNTMERHLAAVSVIFQTAAGQQKQIGDMKAEVSELEAADALHVDNNGRYVELLYFLFKEKLPLSDRARYFSSLYGFLKKAEKVVEEETPKLLERYKIIPDMEKPLSKAQSYAQTMPEYDGTVKLEIVRSENEIDYDISESRK